MAARRLAGSSIRVAGDAVIELTLVPDVGLRFAAGGDRICARSTAWRQLVTLLVGIAGPPWPPATMSLSLTPNASLTALALASSTRVPVTCRRGDTGALKPRLGASKYRAGLPATHAATLTHGLLQQPDDAGRRRDAHADQRTYRPAFQDLKPTSRPFLLRWSWFCVMFNRISPSPAPETPSTMA